VIVEQYLNNFGKGSRGTLVEDIWRLVIRSKKFSLILEQVLRQFQKLFGYFSEQVLRQFQRLFGYFSEQVLWRSGFGATYLVTSELVLEIVL